MSDNIASMKKLTPQEYMRHLKEQGLGILTVLDPKNEDISGAPAWLDNERFERAKLAVSKYYIGIEFSSFTGLLLVLQLPEGLEPLLSTGNSKDLPSLYKRYLSTIMHVHSWYEEDIFNPETKAYRSIRQVRSMHRRVAQLMNDIHQVPGAGGKKRVWLNQYDMAMTQFAFIGLSMLFPRKCGLIAASTDDLESINYYWRAIGHCMGIKEEFNLCRYDSYDDIYEVHRLLFEEEYKKLLEQERCELGLRMTQGICEALQFYMPLVTFNNLAHWWADCFHFNGYEPQPQTIKEKLLAAFMKLSFDHLLNYSSLLEPLAKVHKRQFLRRLKKKDEVYRKLADECAKDDRPERRFISERYDYAKKAPLSCPFRIDTAYETHFKPATMTAQVVDAVVPAMQPETAYQAASEEARQLEEDLNGNCADGQRQAMMVKSASRDTVEQQAGPVMTTPSIVSPC